MISFIDHVAVAVRDYEKARDFFTKIFGARPEVGAPDPGMGYFWHTYSLGSLSRFELLTPRGPKSFLDNFLSDREGGVHHITMRTDSIVKAKERLEKFGVPYFGYNDRYSGWKELFIHPRDAFGVLIQIAEFIPDEWLSADSKFPEGKKFSVEKTGDGALLRLAHPAGGAVEISLDNAEIDELYMELRKAVSARE
ncbi:MAG TPA: VOC family protein [Spirochaetota bacterium]|nr:VOC family protein [Spirochaetota bacterium]HSA15247.1 VOC family protein [Spirochaetota bacterium]